MSRTNPTLEASLKLQSQLLADLGLYITLAECFKMLREAQEASQAVKGGV